MYDEKREKEASNRAMSFMDLLKLLGAFAVFIPLMTGILQYRQSVQQDLDKSFRTTIEKLSSKDREERLAVASSIGTFIKKDSKYYSQVVDILVNRLSIELDYNILNALRGSLEKTEKEDTKYVIGKLLDLERNTLIQAYALNNWKNDTRAAFEDNRRRFDEEEMVFKNSKSEADRNMLENLKDAMNKKWNIYIDREKEYTELWMHKQVISDFISVFLGVTKSYPVTGLVFFRNSLNNVVLVETNLINSEFKLSALSSSRILDTKFDGSTIINTVFTSSILTNSSFANCKISTSLFDRANLKDVDFSGSEFREVFFADADLTGADFNTTKGLKPIYFYKAKNLDKALFDPAFKKELSDELANTTDDIFKEYVNKSDLDEDKIKTLYENIDIVSIMNK